MRTERIEDLVQRNQELQERLEEAEATLRAIRNGDVDAVVIASADGDAVYTLKGADENYGLLVELCGARKPAGSQGLAVVERSREM